jgi:hypothetical protein
MVTALALMAIYQSPHVPLREVCERYFSLSYEEALPKACRNELPVPTFRLTSSRKSPLLVSCQELGRLYRCAGRCSGGYRQGIRSRCPRLSTRKSLMPGTA